MSCPAPGNACFTLGPPGIAQAYPRDICVETSWLPRAPFNPEQKKRFIELNLFRGELEPNCSNCLKTIQDSPCIQYNVPRMDNSGTTMRVAMLDTPYCREFTTRAVEKCAFQCGYPT